MRRRWFALVAVAASSTACTSQDTSPSSTDSTVASASSTVVTLGTQTSVLAGSSDSAGTSLTPEPGGLVVVDGGLLPRAVVDAITRRGGELVDSSVWDARFETYGLPHVVGDGVMLVEASLDATRDVNGWQRVDQLQWLLEDASQHGASALLDQAAAAAGVSGLAVVETTELVDGAECTKRVYTDSASASAFPTVWTLQGCAFPNLPGMYSLGIGREGGFVGTEAPTVEPSVGQVANTLGGTVDEVHVAFGHPEATGSVTTLRITAHVSFDGDVASAVAAVAGGPLAGWQQVPGDASVMLSGTGGANWVISDGTARFSFDGRLQS